MSLRLGAAFGSILLAVFAPALALAQDPDTLVVSRDPARYGIVVSATRSARRALELPNAATVVRGDDLRRRGARTLADALADVAGLETGGGTDNGSRLPNIGLWGLKEFDALLITVDGVPVGGPFNPSLAQIPVGDIERIEIVKGPQGSLYGLAAFAGMVQVFTTGEARDGVTGTVGGGSFASFDGRVSLHRALATGALDATVAGEHSDGWQDRTASDVIRGRLTYTRPLGATKVTLSVTGLRDRQDWGSPVPVDAGRPLPGFENPERNVAIGGAVMEHTLFGLGLHSATPLGRFGALRNVASFTHDGQKAIRSFVGEVTADTVDAEAIALEPEENSFYEDLSLLSRFRAGGAHELVTGVALTAGATEGEGKAFEFDQLLSDPSTIPNWRTEPATEDKEFDDERLYVGLYAHDSWTPARAFTLSGGGRWDHAHEKLTTGEPGDPDAGEDERDDSAWSGDLGALVRLLPERGAGALGALNAYGNWKSSFKPAAPNLTEAEDAHILDPERTHSLEGGLKGEAFAGQLEFDVAAFQLDFHNMVVGILNESNQPELVNAGHERFKGWEVSARLAPAAAPGLAFSAGWAHHDPRFVEFTFVTPDGSLRNVSGKLIELAPRELWNGGVAYAPAHGLGGWVAYRHQGRRPLTRRNTFWTGAFDETDAGLTFATARATVSVTGRNLGDSRHYVSESDVGDSQFYVAAPRRVAGQLTVAF